MDLYYFSLSPPCWSVLLLGHQLDIKFNMKPIDFFSKAHLKEDFIKLNPVHKVPTLQEGEFTLSESRAILSYLVDAHAQGSHPLYPSDAKVRALIQQQLNFDLGIFYHRIYDYCSPLWKSKTTGSEADRERLHEALGFLEAYLGRTRYVAGNGLTIADISMMASASVLVACKFSLEKFPKVFAWYETCKKELVGYQDVMGPAFEGFARFVGKPTH
ncbi:glutathione S-transferase 4-like [Toxorhynchites rutilus septentrionalis]|uniref:glutathione S-transferase 4-like n=1 Tax=Toxorhynchites rutilus septentrionalis TaxID=329112 RepID=UPI002478899D|nr:glutathione S-transferase 4-like [Toxorhynchites rutilus septentrionalis]